MDLPLTPRPFKPRLQRLKWLFTDHPLYFLTSCTESRRPILSSVSVHRSFVTFAAQGAEYGVFTGFYTIMPDHIHLFAAFTREEIPLSKWMKSLKNSLSKVLRESGADAPHWQKGFFDHVMRSEESYIEKMAYVRQNPVRAGLVKHAEEWPYQGEIFRLEFRK
jgi:REP-associated tyrosine transposase